MELRDLGTGRGSGGRCRGFPRQVAVEGVAGCESGVVRVSNVHGD